MRLGSSCTLSYPLTRHTFLLRSSCTRWSLQSWSVLVDKNHTLFFYRCLSCLVDMLLSPCRCRCPSCTRWQTNLVHSADISYSHREKTNQLGMLGKILHPSMSFGTALLGMGHMRRPIQYPLLHRHTWCIWHCLDQTFLRHRKSCMMFASWCWCSCLPRKVYTLFGSFDRCTHPECTGDSFLVHSKVGTLLLDKLCSGWRLCHCQHETLLPNMVYMVSLLLQHCT